MQAICKMGNRPCSGLEMRARESLSLIGVAIHLAANYCRQVMRKTWSTQTTRPEWSTTLPRLHKVKARAIIDLLAQGKTTRQICEELNVSEHSVEVIRIREAQVIALLKLKDPADSSGSKNQVSDALEAAVTFGKCIDELVKATPVASMPTMPTRSKERMTFAEALERLPSSADKAESCQDSSPS